MFKIILLFSWDIQIKMFSSLYSYLWKKKKKRSYEDMFRLSVANVKSTCSEERKIILRKYNAPQLTTEIKQRFPFSATKKSFFFFLQLTNRIKHDNHVTLLATIYSRANTTHVLFSQQVLVAMRHHQMKPNTIHQITSRY
jgi:hypothetical protein